MTNREMVPFMVAVGDPHYTESAWVNRKDTAGDADVALRQAVDLALQLDVPLLAAGDIMDSARPSPEVIHQFVQRVRPLKKFYYIKGNHDDRSPRSWPDLSEVCEWVGHGRPFYVGLASIVGLDWTPAWALKPTIEKLDLYTKNVDVFVCHQSWKQFQTMGVAEGDLADVKMAPDCFIFTGDYHQSLEVQVPETLHYVRAISPGSLHLTTIDEEVQKYAYIFRQCGDRHDYRIDVVRQPLVSRQVVRMSLAPYNEASVLADIAALRPVEPYPGVLLKPFVRLEYPADMNIKEAVKAAADKAVLFMDPISEGRRAAVSDPRSRVETLETAVAKVATSEAVANAAITMLRTPKAERAAVLHQMRQSYISNFKASIQG